MHTVEGARCTVFTILSHYHCCCMTDVRTYAGSGRYLGYIGMSYIRTVHTFRNTNPSNEQFNTPIEIQSTHPSEVGSRTKGPITVCFGTVYHSTPLRPRRARGMKILNVSLVSTSISRPAPDPPPLHPFHPLSIDICQKMWP